jgi:hypothetical protein
MTTDIDYSSQNSTVSIDPPAKIDRVIFLDCDGVLTMTRCLLCDYSDGDSSLIFPKDLQLGDEEYKGLTPLELDRLQNLKWLVDESNAHIVLSTTWRQDPNMRNFLIAALSHVGIPPDKVVGDTPNSPLEGRGGEIRAWLSNNTNYKRFVAIDDDHETSIVAYLGADHYVQTLMSSSTGNSFEEGLTREKAEIACRILITD